MAYFRFRLLRRPRHREIWKDHGPRIDLAVSRPDVVILAGDIDTWARGVEWARRFFAGLPVIYVHGNHEAYGHQLEAMQRDFEAACAATPNVRFLDCGEFHHENVRSLGATIWADFCLFGEDAQQVCMRSAQEVILDYQWIRLINEGDRKLRAGDTATFHAQQKVGLEKMLKEKHNGPILD